MLSGDWSFFATLGSDKYVPLWQFTQALLQNGSVWMESTAIMRRPAIRPFVSAVGDHSLARAACLLQHLGFAVVVRGKNTHETPVFFVVIVKGHLVQDAPQLIQRESNKEKRINKKQQKIKQTIAFGRTMREHSSVIAPQLFT